MCNADTRLCCKITESWGCGNNQRPLLSRKLLNRKKQISIVLGVVLSTVETTSSPSNDRTTVIYAFYILLKTLLCSESHGGCVSTGV